MNIQGTTQTYYRTVFTNKQKEFFNRIGTHLSRFWSLNFGFDVVAFNDWVQTPEDTSLREHLTNKYNEDTTNFVFGLI